MNVTGTIDFNYKFKEYQKEELFELNVPGIYFFKNREGKVIYVGQSANVGSRIFNHLSGAGRSAMFFHEIENIFVYTDIEAEELDITEMICIHKLKPVYNVQSKDRCNIVHIDALTITDEQVYKIYHLSENRYNRTSCFIAKELGVTSRVVSDVLAKKRKHYKDIYEQYKKDYPSTNFDEYKSGSPGVAEFITMYEEGFAK